MKAMILTLSLSAFGALGYFGFSDKPIGFGVAAQAHSLPALVGTPKSWHAECGSCHLAFPPSLMSGMDWANTMQGLNKHFGSDASLSPAEVKEISAFLQRNAAAQDARYQSTQNPPRITRTPFFERKHRKLPATVWADDRIKSAVNCVACHSGAEAGNFHDDDVTVPGFPGKRW